jgi:phage gp36-like protein
MPTTRVYCTAAALVSRLSEPGLVACADDDGDGIASATEKAAALTPSLAWAATQIDAALLTAGIDAPLVQDESNLNAMLEQIAIDLCMYRLATRRGQGASQSMIDAAEMARSDLKRIASGALRVPGIEYPGQSIDTRAAIGRPVAANPCRRGRW